MTLLFLKLAQKLRSLVNVGLRCYRHVLCDTLWVSILLKGCQENFQRIRASLTGLFLSCCCYLMLALLFAVCISSVHPPSTVFSVTHTAAERQGGWHYVNTTLLAARHHQKCPFCSVPGHCSFFLAWGEGETFPQSIVEKEQGVADKKNCAVQWEIIWHLQRSKAASWLYDPLLTFPFTMMLSVLETCLWGKPDLQSWAS